MRKKLLRQAVAFLLMLFSALAAGQGAIGAEDPCDGPMREAAIKHGVVCPPGPNERRLPPPLFSPTFSRSSP